MQTFTLELLKIQPSQLYIHRGKLDLVQESLASGEIKVTDPLPVKKIGGNLFFTDGHTRALALYLQGVKEINVYWDEDDLDWLNYLVCVDWCNQADIKNIGDLAGKIVSNEEYQQLWLERCQKMQSETKGNPEGFLHIREVKEPSKKGRICDTILRELPEWFGIEEAIQEYTEKSQGQFFLASYVGDLPVGFIAIEKHYQKTSEIYVTGIVRELHKRGLGRRLIQKVEEELKAEGQKFLTVKTLSESHSDPNYQKTRKFYLAMGFVPLEEFKTLWGEANPCLFLAKYLG